MRSLDELPLSRQVEYDDTSVVAYVNDRSECDLTKRFDDLHIDWPWVERAVPMDWVLPLW